MTSTHGFPYDRIVEKCKEVLSEDSRCWSDEIKEQLNMAPHWSAEKWTDVLSKGRGEKKRFHYCLKPKCPEKLLYLQAIQGHSGKAYSGNARGFSTKTDRYAVFFTVVNPMDDEQGLRETFCDLSKAREAPYKSTWCNLLPAQEERMQFYQTRSNGVVLCTHTHLLHAHFSVHSALTAYFAHLHACHTHAWLKCSLEVVFVRMSFLS